MQTLQRISSYSSGISSESNNMAHKISNVQIVPSWSSSPLRFLKSIFNDSFQLEWLKRYMLSSLDTAQSFESNLTTSSDEDLLLRRPCNTSRHFSFDGWRSFLAMKMDKFLLELDWWLEMLAKDANTVSVATPTVWTWSTLSLTNTESPMAPIVFD